MGAARAKYELPGGGFLMVIFDCWVENYVPANACSGYGNKATALAAAAALPHGGEQQQEEEGAERDEALIYTCYADSKTKAFPVKRMMDYLDSVVRTALDSRLVLLSTTSSQCFPSESHCAAFI